MEKLYEEYGKLMIQLEITQGKINECKRRIAEELNKSIPTSRTGNSGEDPE